MNASETQQIRTQRHPVIHHAQETINNVLDSVEEFSSIVTVERNEPEENPYHTHINLDTYDTTHANYDEVASIRMFHPTTRAKRAASKEWSDFKRVVQECVRDTTILCTWTLAYVHTAIQKLMARAREALEQHTTYEHTKRRTRPAYALEDLVSTHTHEKETPMGEHTPLPSNTGVKQISLQVTHIVTNAPVSIRVDYPATHVSPRSLEEHPLVLPEEEVLNSKTETMYVESGPNTFVMAHALRIVARKLRQGIDI